MTDDADSEPDAGPAGTLVPSFDFQRSGSGGVGTLTARLGDDVLAVEKLDLLRARQRADFIDRLCANRPEIDRAAVESETTRLAADAAARPQPTPTDAPEVEVSRIVRPELFHTTDVSGVAVPIPTVAAGKPAGRWVLYLRWHADGRRERRELASSIDLPDGGRLWVSPIPADPLPNMQPAWSAAARRAWLDGADAPDPADVFKRICELIACFVELPAATGAGTTATLAVWVMLSYVYLVWRSVPYLHVGGPAESGKSTLFAVLMRLVFRPLASSNVSAALLFRTLHELGGTLLLNEAERLRDQSPDAGELRSILLSGYKAGSPAMRLEKAGDTFRRVQSDVFGPKALAGIAALPEALASRCIRLTIFRAPPDSPKPRRRIDADPSAWQAVRDDLHALALDNGPA